MSHSFASSFIWHGVCYIISVRKWDNDIVKTLKQHNIIDDYIFKYYDSLHSQSLEYAVDSILELLENKENRKNYDKGISRRNWNH